MSASLGATTYTAVTWTTGDTITEAKMDNMVANDQAYDSHEAQGLTIANTKSLGARNVADSDYLNIAKLDGSDDLVLGDTGVGLSATNLIADEDDMSSDSVDKLATQQSIKAFVEGVPTNTDITLDEDDMSSDSASKLATQQSIKAYADSVTGKFYGARAYSASNQAINSATLTKVTLGTENYDIGSDFASSRYTAPVTGYYSIKGHVSFAVTSNSDELQAIIRLNGSNIAFSAVESGGTANHRLSVCTDYYMTAGQYVELYAMNWDNNDTIVSGNDDTFMSVHLIGI